MKSQPNELSSLSRYLTYLVGILFAIVGLILFFAPGLVSANFAWKVTPFVTMTIGGWCLGTAAYALLSARIWRWSLVFACLIYLWVFGVLETGVLALHSDRVTLNSPIAWLYTLTLVLSVVAAALGILDWLRLRPDLKPEGRPLTPVLRLTAILFAAFVLFLALFAMIAPTSKTVTEGRIFPESLSVFTIHAFGAFYLSLSLSALSLLGLKGRSPGIIYTWSGLVLLVPILLAALVNLDKFDFTARPGGLLYIGTYVVALVAALAIVLYDRRQHGAQPEQRLLTQP